MNSPDTKPDPVEMVEAANAKEALDVEPFSPEEERRFVPKIDFWYDLTTTQMIIFRRH